MYKYLIFILILVGCHSYNIDDLVIRNENKHNFNTYFNIKEFNNKTIIESGNILLTNPLCWGDKSSDDTGILQKALDSGANIVVIPKSSSPWITKPLFIQSNTIIYFEEGSILEALKGDFLGKSDSLINIIDAENISIYGYGAKLKMWRDDYDKKPYEKAQWRHSISIKSSKNILVEGFTILESGGDGIYLGQKKNSNKNIILKNLTILDQYRQGISVTSVNGLFIENVVVSGTKGHLPEAGIDFEPNRDSKELKNIELVNCTFVNNKGPGFLVSLQNFSTKEQSLDIIVSNSTFNGSIFGLSIMNTQHDPYGNITFNNVFFKGLKLNFPGKNLVVEFNN